MVVFDVMFHVWIWFILQIGHSVSIRTVNTRTHFKQIVGSNLWTSWMSQEIKPHGNLCMCIEIVHGYVKLLTIFELV